MTGITGVRGNSVCRFDYCAGTIHIGKKQRDEMYEKRDNIVVYVIGRAKRSAESTN